MLALSLEFNLTLACISAFAMPVVSKLDEPIPLCMYWVFCVMGIYTMIKIGPHNE